MAASRVNHLYGALLATSLASATLLAGCGRHHVEPAGEASVPAVRPDALAGAPSDAPVPPPAAPAQPPATYEPAPPPPPPAGRPGDKEVIYDLGPVVRPHDSMAPIANPTEARPAVARPAAKAAEATPPQRARRADHRIHHQVATAPARPAARATAKPTVAKPAGAKSAGAKPAAAKPVVTAKAAHPATTTPAAKTAPAAKVAHPGTASTAAPRDAVPIAPSKRAAHASAHAAKAHAPKPAAATSGEVAQRLSALQTALREAVSRTAALRAPELKAAQPAEVTLTLPADFASVVRDEAAKQKLSDAAASVNMTAILAGDGYAVAPDETQSQPLTVGQPTEFHWTVTAQPGAHGPIHADVGADLLGGGDAALQLGTLSPVANGLHVSSRAWGVGLLVLLAIIVFAWLSRSRREAARRASKASTRASERPLDMRSAPPPPADRNF